MQPICFFSMAWRAPVAQPIGCALRSKYNLFEVELVKLVLKILIQADVPFGGELSLNFLGS